MIDLTNLLLSQLWQVTVLVALVGFADQLLIRRCPQLLYGLWLIVFVKALVPPIWSSRLGFFSWAATGLFPNQGAAVFFSPAVGAEWGPVVYGLLAVWAAGAIIAMAIVTARWTALRKHLRGAAARVEPELQQRIAGVAAELGFSKCPTLAICDATGPGVFGVLRPTVCLPSRLDYGDWDRVRPIVVHELVHLRRRDNVISVLQLIVLCLWWFHPLAWWASRRLTRSIEFCVDRQVAATQGCSPRSYAKALLGVLELKVSHSPLTGMSGISPTMVTLERVEHVICLGCRGAHREPRGWQLWALCGALSLVFLPGGGLPVFVPSCTPALVADPVAAPETSPSSIPHRAPVR